MTDKHKVHLGNLSFQTTLESLKREFSTCGAIAAISMPTDRETGKPRGFAFVTFETAEGQKNALEKNGMKLDGRPIKVSEARPATNGPRTNGYHHRAPSHHHDHHGEHHED